MKIKIYDSAKTDYMKIRATLLNYDNIPANKFRKTYMKFQSNVKRMPEMYPVCEYNPMFRTAVLIYDYIVFYKVDETTSSINVFRILHGNRNIIEILKYT